MSEFRSSTVALTIAPCFESPGQRPFALATTPGRTASLTSATAKKEPRSFAITHFISRCDISWHGIVRMDQESRWAGSQLLPSNIGEYRVQEIVTRWSDQCERVFA